MREVRAKYPSSHWKSSLPRFFFRSSTTILAIVLAMFLSRSPLLKSYLEGSMLLPLYNETISKTKSDHNQTSTSSFPATKESSSNTVNKEMKMPLSRETNTPAGTNLGKTLSVGMGFQGRIIPECCSSFCEIEAINTEIVHELLQTIVETPFFSHFSIDLCSSCELWEDAPLCSMKDCSVCECEEPPTWSLNQPHLPSTGPDCSRVADDMVVTSADQHIVDAWLRPNNESPSLSKPPNVQVVDLRKNPEGYTGYTGASAEKVWRAIHSENCFQTTATIDDMDSCFLSKDQRVYNRFISGIHSSISLHIAHSYCLEMDKQVVGECSIWGLNDEIAFDRVLSHQDRVENLFVAYSLLLRAVMKAGRSIASAVPIEDPLFHSSLKAWNESLLPGLLTLPQIAPEAFDENSLIELLDHTSEDYHRLKTSTGATKRAELQKRFEHLQSIMQCVGCDRCKLWGTLQAMGVGTALKILFQNERQEAIELSRQEAVALVNTLERLSSSLLFAREFKMRKQKNKNPLEDVESQSPYPCFL